MTPEIIEIDKVRNRHGAIVYTVSLQGNILRVFHSYPSAERYAEEVWKKVQNGEEIPA